MTLSQISSTISLLSVVDNSQHIYMRPIFDQEGACCGQASGVAYTYTYEINWLRNLPADDEINEDNWYPTHYTWNFLNNGMGMGSWYFDGWDIIKENGCPNVPTWGEGMGGWRIWMDGYEKYYTGMFNKLDSYWFIDVSTPEGLETFKHWINDHNAGIGIGGLGCFATYMSGFEYDFLPPESNDPGKKIMSDWIFSTNGFHAMTFVGYNDGILYDINDDGEFTNDEDTNGDGIIDMLDWEIGALKLANSSGESWPGGPLTDGYSYIPYRLLPLELQNPDTPYNIVPVLWDKKVHVIQVSDENPPILTVKTKIGYPRRSRLKLKIGYANNANQTVPIEDFSGFSSFNHQGGGLPMSGINNDPIEIGLDYGYWYLNKDFGKVFFIIEEGGLGTPGNGEIHYFSIVDYRWGEEFELFCDQENVPIVIEGETILSIDYDLIPHEENITENLNLFSNMVSRFTPTVSNNATLTIENGVEVDMYNSQITIAPGATLIIEDNVTITGKSGQNSLIIDGNIQIGDNVTFIDINGIMLNNENLQTTFNETSLIRSFVLNKGMELNITDCDFDDCDVLWSVQGNVNITYSNFYCTWLLLDNLIGTSSNIVNISNNDFWGDQGCPSGVFISDYDRFFVEYNEFDDCGTGIQIYESGNGTTGNQSIFENEITACDNKGIIIYDSKASIAGNEIFNNEYGIWLTNRRLAMQEPNYIQRHSKSMTTIAMKSMHQNKVSRGISSIM
jgi:hypothetical protein